MYNPICIVHEMRSVRRNVENIVYELSFTLCDTVLFRTFLATLHNARRIVNIIYNALTNFTSSGAATAVKKTVMPTAQWDILYGILNRSSRHK